MIKEINFKGYFREFCDKSRHHRVPVEGQIKLTYLCNYRCVYCYCTHCNNIINEKKELNFIQWKDILDQIHELGGICLTITGGEALLHRNFLRIYDYARNKGFLVTIFTNGFLLDDEIIKHFVKNPPFSIELTLNGITKRTYESITQVPDSFRRIMDIIKNIVSNNLPLVLKTMGLKENKNEILKIKEFAEKLLGKGKYCFDSFVAPCLDGSPEPVSHRLSIKEILEIENQDSNMMANKSYYLRKPRNQSLPKEYLYHCSSWITNYIINPYGLLQFCNLTRKYSTDLTKESFREGFYNVFPRLLREKYKSDSKCIDCKYRYYCFHCPSRAYLETGDEEAPVEYFCQLARANWKLKESNN